MTDNLALGDADEKRRLWNWQIRLVPYVLAGMALLAAVFFVATFIQFNRLNEAVTYSPDPRLESALKNIDAQAARLPPAEASEILRWKTMVLLESDVVRHRYSQVNSTLLMRAWTRSIGFITGMILSFIGSLFILAKLSEAQSNIQGEGAGMKASLATSSPGLVLATLGTVLMITTLVTNFSYGTSDRPVYLPRVTTTAMPPPAEMPDGNTAPSDPGATPPPAFKPRLESNASD